MATKQSHHHHHHDPDCDPPPEPCDPPPPVFTPIPVPTGFPPELNTNLAATPEDAGEFMYFAYFNYVKLYFAVPPPSWIQLDEVTRGGWLQAATNVLSAIESLLPPPPEP
jgi:hypothetical protein